MITYQEEIVCDELYDECEHLFLSHKEEVSDFKEALNIDVLTYIRLYRFGKFKFFSARSNDKVIGYIAFMIIELPHYKTLSAEQDILYVSPDYRKGSVGIKLMKYSEKMLKSLGVVRIMQHSKSNNDISPLFTRMGYKPFEVIYAKEL